MNVVGDRVVQPGGHAMHLSVRRTFALVGALALWPAWAQAAPYQPTTVSTTAARSVPQVVPSSATAYPRVDALAVAEGKAFAGGDFHAVTQDGTSYAGLNDLVSFNAATGAVYASFQPTFDAPVRALEYDPVAGALFVGGNFTTVNGQPRSGLVKLDATTGAVIGTFKPYFKAGRINDLQLQTLGGRLTLIVAWNQPKKLAAVDPVTGQDTGYFTTAIADAIPGAWGTVAVHQVAVNPAATRLVATGNFRTVDGVPRTRFLMLDLGATGARLNPWYYQPFAKPCASTAPRRIAYLQGVDWAPDGRAFNVAATGQVPKYRSEIWHAWDSDAHKSQSTICDAVGRFSPSDPTKPVWVNYTGGDSVWAVQDTGSAVYVSGHFQWLDNPDGAASKPAAWTGPAMDVPVGDKTTGQLAKRRLAIGAVDPITGHALDWAPNAAGFKQGGKALLVTNDGLWIGNDSKRYGRDAHYGLAFAPLG